ncbi:MAG: glycogen/starch/alpha-glucan phosphorylase [Solobacterium sp.]|nr:glycogen/starch/alpha-glucan phosphorylase [Solobacterium sp.]
MFKNKQDFKKEFSNRLITAYGTTVAQTHPTEKYLVLSEMVRDQAGINWKDSKVQTAKQDAKQVYYFSMEFLLGRSLLNNLQNLGVYEIARDGLKDLGIDIKNLISMEKDAGLGNGGLGRLAACFMDSAASLNYPVNGNCIRYQSGLFAQVIDKDGRQVEMPDMWLRIGNPWEIRKPKHAVEVLFYGNVEVQSNGKGGLRFRHVNAEHILAVPYDMPMIGANTKMTNTLRLWSAEPADISPAGIDYRKYLASVNEICQNVYPDDSTEAGKILRLKQQYFFVSAGINSILISYLQHHDTLDHLGDHIAIQLNDTHPVFLIAELQRILMDEYDYEWDDAMKITQSVISYTNHTVMSEALESWPIDYVRRLLPRIYMIIEEIDRRFVNYVRENVTQDHGYIERIRPISGGRIHMARLAVICSHAVNGVARIHTGLLKTDLFKEYAQMWPERFQNKTNGITPRRWMLYSNPELAEMLDGVIGKGYRKDFSKIIKLMDHVDDPKVQRKFLAVKRKRKVILSDYIKRTTGVDVNPDSIFDTQAKRIHAYKRQLLNIMHVIYLYQRIKSDPSFTIYPHTFIFAGKAAPAYTFAKSVIHLINCVARKVNNDPDVKGMIKVVFMPNYRVTMSEYLMNGTDVSEQISTAGKEASGTGNMKFMMNGALLIGTLDGANVEIDELIGRENDVIFGMTVEEIEQRRHNYHASDYYGNDERIRRILDSLLDGTWSENREDFRIIYDEILFKNDEYFVLADFDAYVKAQKEMAERYQHRYTWARSCLINIAQSCYFSSDRTIKEYAEEIWNIQPVSFRG